MGAKVTGASGTKLQVQGQEDKHSVFGHKYVMDDEEWDIHSATE